MSDPKPRKNDKSIGICFVISALASLGLAVVYFFGGQPQLEGILLGVALGGIAIGMILGVKILLPHGPDVQERGELASTEEDRSSVVESVGESDIGRRNFIIRSFGAALGALGIAALFPIRSLGTRPGRDLFETAWREGSRMVTETGQLVQAEDLAVNGILTVFPEGSDRRGRLANGSDPAPRRSGRADGGHGRVRSRCVLEDMHTRGMSRGSLPGNDSGIVLPVSPVGLRSPSQRRAQLGAGDSSSPPPPDRGR